MHPQKPGVLSERERAVSLFFGRRTALHQLRKFIFAQARGRLKFDLAATRTHAETARRRYLFEHLY